MFEELSIEMLIFLIGAGSVSYTHLDVYKRQVDNIRDLNFPRDVRELLVNYILVKKLSFLSSVPQTSSTSQPSNINQSERVFTS